MPNNFVVGLLQYMYMPGKRIELRDAEWRIENIDNSSHIAQMLTCACYIESVRGITDQFMIDFKVNSKVLSPEMASLPDVFSHGSVGLRLC